MTRTKASRRRDVEMMRSWDMGSQLLYLSERLGGRGVARAFREVKHEGQMCAVRRRNRPGDLPAEDLAQLRKSRLKRWAGPREPKWRGVGGVRDLPSDGRQTHRIHHQPEDTKKRIGGTSGEADQPEKDHRDRWKMQNQNSP